MGGKDNEPQPITPGDGDYSRQDAPAKKSWLARYHSILIAAFLLANIIVLYVLHFADRGSSSSDSVASTFTSTTLSSEQSSSDSASKGQAVSLDASGKLTVGAGTTAYLAAATLPSEDQYMAYIKFAPLGTSESSYATNLVSYQLGSSEIESVVTTFSVDASEKKVTLADAESGNTISGATIKGLTTLSDSKAVALSSITSADGYSYSVYVTPVTIADEKVTLEQDQTTFAINNSATNFMTRLSDSSFAVAYYEPYSEEGYYQRLIVGSIADDNKVSLTDSIEFGNVNGALSTTFGTPKAITSDSDKKFVVPWFVDDYTATKDNQTIAGSVGLCLLTANYTSGVIAEADTTCDTAVEPAYYVDSARLEDNVVAFIFFDRANNFALTILVAEYSSITGIPTFRGSYVLEEAAGAFDFGSAYGFYPTPTIRALPDSRLAVGFLNPSNSGKPSVKVLKYGSDFSISEVSPVLPVSNEDFSVSSADPNAYGAIVLDTLPVSSGFVVSYAGLWAGSQNQRIALVESLGKPIGVVSDASSSELKVAMSGTVDVSDLTSGTSYYASTSGTLYAPTTATADDYILTQDNTIVISKDALVGVAISGSSLIVTV